MREKSNYLKTILTVNALLLGGLLWTQVAATPVLEQTAQAQSKRAQPLNAANQRKQMSDAVLEMKKSVERVAQLLESGKVTVRVANINDVQVTGASDRR